MKSDVIPVTTTGPPEPNAPAGPPGDPRRAATAVNRPPRVGARARRRWQRWLLVVLLCVLSVPFIFPTWWMATSSLKPMSEILRRVPTIWPQDPSLDAYGQVFALQPFAQQYWNSLYIAAVVTIVPLFRIVNSLGLIDTHWPLIVIPMLGAPAVLAVFIMRQFFLALPAELEEAGRIDGLGRWGLFWRIALPLSRSALGAVAIFTFLKSWNLYLEPIVYLSSKESFTLPQALTQYVDAYGGPMWNVQLAATTLTVLPVLAVFLVAQKQFVQGLAHSGLKG